MKSKYNSTFSLLFIFIVNTIFSQELIQKEWEQNYGYQNTISNTSIDHDVSGNLFVVGHVQNGVEGDNIITLKYNEYGSLLWSKQYHAGSDDKGFKAESDISGNIYTLGSIGIGGGNFVSILIKYNSSGTLLWTRMINVGTSTTPVDLVAKTGGNIYVLTKNTISGQQDAVVTEINPMFGSIINQNNYDSGNEDTPVNLEYQSGVLLIGVQCQSAVLTWSNTLALNSSLALIWSYNFSGSGFDDVKSVKFTNTGNAIVLLDVGATHQAQVNKISAAGTLLWSVELDEGNTFTKDKSLFVDDTDKILIAFGHNSNNEISTNLIDDSGNILWNKYYYGTGVNFDEVGIISDGSNIICSANEVSISNTNLLLFNMGYDAVLKWEARESGGAIANLGDITINANDDVVIAGQVEAGAGYELGVIDYTENEAYDAEDVSDANSGFLAYFQNYGRIKDLSGSVVDGLSYSGAFGDEALYFFDNSIAITHFKTDFDDATVDSIYRLDLLFTGDVNQTTPAGLKPVGYHTNYYYSDLKREKINGFKKIIYPNLYDKIDLEVGENEFGPLFSFIIYPGADISDVQIEVDGATELYGGFVDSALITSFLEFSTPRLYTEDPFGDPLVIPYDTTSYGYDIDSTGKIAFGFPTMVNTTNDVIVVQLGRRGERGGDRSADDNFNWSSYIREPSVSSWGGVINKIDSDESNNTYYTGHNRAIDGSKVFPTTTGAAFEFPRGESDITIMKLNDNVEREWATYYGGSSFDEGRSITTNNDGTHIYIVGSSSSTSFPTQAGADGAYINGADGNSFILQLNIDGTAFWATKFPAILKDCEIVNNYLYVVGARLDVGTPALIDDTFNFYSTNGSGYIGVFKAGGIHTHSTGFGSSLSFGGHTEIYGIDWDGESNYAITGESADPNHPLINAPLNHEYKSGTYKNNAFVANLNTTGGVDFSYYISSIETAFILTFGGDDQFYNSLGDRGNDVKFSPDGEHVYVIGEAYGEELYTVASSNPDAYYQSTRFPANNGGGVYRPAGFIYKSENDGDEVLLTYFSASELIETHPMMTRLEEIAFDDLGNYFISGHQIGVDVESSTLPANYNIPLPVSQPYGFYQKAQPTYSSLVDECDGIGGLSAESYIIAFNNTDEHIWSTYVGGNNVDQIKPIAVTNSRYLYFGGTAETINLNIPERCPDLTPEQYDEVKFPVWEYNEDSDLDWFNGSGTNSYCEIAGRFDVNGVNDAGPLLNVNKIVYSNKLLIYPNPHQNGNLYFSVQNEKINSIKIYSLEGKIIRSNTENDIQYINIDNFSSGTYIIECQTASGTHQNKFIKN